MVSIAEGEAREGCEEVLVVVVDLEEEVEGFFLDLVLPFAFLRLLAFRPMRGDSGRGEVLGVGRG